MTEKIKITTETTVRDIILANYNTKKIFEKHGMKNCGGKYGPKEKLGFFLRVHGITGEDAERFIRDLQNCPQGKMITKEEMQKELEVQKEKQKGFLSKLFKK